jgi:membrane protein implicated in regulation of membrane protease activity
LIRPDGHGAARYGRVRVDSADAESLDDGEEFLVQQVGVVQEQVEEGLGHVALSCW